MSPSLEPSTTRPPPTSGPADNGSLVFTVQARLPRVGGHRDDFAVVRSRVHDVLRRRSDATRGASARNRRRDRRSRADRTSRFGSMSTSSAGGSTSLSLSHAASVEQARAARQPARRERDSQRTSWHLPFAAGVCRLGRRQPALRRRRPAASVRAVVRSIWPHRLCGQRRGIFRARAPCASPFATCASPRISRTGAANAPAFSTSSSCERLVVLALLDQQARQRAAARPAPAPRPSTVSTTCRSSVHGLVELARIDVRFASSKRPCCV